MRDRSSEGTGAKGVDRHDCGEDERELSGFALECGVEPWIRLYILLSGSLLRTTETDPTLTGHLNGIKKELVNSKT